MAELAQQSAKPDRAEQRKADAASPSYEEGAVTLVEQPTFVAALGDPGNAGSRYAALLRDPRVRATSPVQRARLLRQIQRSHGNGHVAQVVARAASLPMQRQPAPAAPAPSTSVEVAEPEEREALRATDSKKEYVTPPEPMPVQRNWFGDAVGSIAGAVTNPRQALLGRIAGLARNIPGYHLLTLVLGRDPISQKVVERNPLNVFRAVLGLAPGGAKLFANLNESGAIDKAFTWLSEQWARLGLTWEAIKGLFKRAWDSLGAGDIFNPSGAFAKVKAIFLGPIKRIKSFVANIGQQIMQFIFEGVLEKLGGGAVLGLLRRAGGVFQSIIKNPIGFIGNLIKGVGQGLKQFVANIGAHLKKGLLGWLFGELAAGGIELPRSFDLRGILALVMQVLGMTWQFIRAKAVKILGEPVVKTLEGAFDIFMIIKEQGVGGLLEFIQDKLGNLKTMVIDGVKDMVSTQVIQAGIQWLMGVLGGPAGAIVKAIKAIYDVVMWFVNNGSRMMGLVRAVLDSVAAIAKGSLGPAAAKVEASLGKAVPITIGFLASLLGLGNLAGKIKGIIEKVQAPVKKAVGWVLGKAKGFAKKLVGKVRGRFSGKPRSEVEKQRALKDGLSAGVAAVNKLKGKKVTAALIQPVLGAIKLRYRLSVLEPVVQDKYWYVHAEVQRAMGKTEINREDEPDSIREEVEMLFAELQGSPTEAAGEQESIRLAAQEQRGKTRLEPTSARFSRAVLHAAIKAVEAPNGTENQELDNAKSGASVIVDKKIDQALAATDGDRIFRILTSAQQAVNNLLKGRIVTIQVSKPRMVEGLETHHNPEVHAHPGTYPKEFRKRVNIPDKWRVEAEKWATELVKNVADKKKRERQRKAYVAQLLKTVRDSLTEAKADQSHRDKAVLEEVEMFVIPTVAHREHHGREGETE
jgi:hypothetical protein